MSDSDHLSKVIDWQAVWQSLDWGDEANSPEAIRRRLRQRAEQAAKPIKKPEIDTLSTFTGLTFTLGAEHYGVDVMLVQGARALGNITRVPGAPRFYRGVVNVRGQIITVIDLRLFFEMSYSEEDPPKELILVRSNNLELGLLAHHVEGVITVPRAAIEPLEDMRFAIGLTMGHIVMLDIERLCEDERLIVGGVDE
jgi:purine-binding chemotaxis protein CheW